MSPWFVFLACTTTAQLGDPEAAGGPDDSATLDSGALEDPSDSGTSDSGAPVDSAADTAAETDGPVCEGLGAVPDGFFAGRFDPARVYLLGTLTPGIGGNDVVAPLEDTSTYLGWFPPDFNAPDAALLGDRLIYYSSYGLWMEDVQISEFNCDQCGDEVVNSGTYEQNDVPLGNAPCGDDWDAMHAVAVSPDARRLVQCDQYGAWYDETGALVLTDVRYITSFGMEGWILTGESSRLVNIDTARAVPLSEDIRFWRITAARARTDGFWVVRRDGDDRSLWLISFDGRVSEVAEYPPVPSGVADAPHTHELDGSGRLYEIAFDDGYHLIYRYGIDGCVELLYSERDNPTVQCHGALLLTGP